MYVYGFSTYLSLCIIIIIIIIIYSKVEDLTLLCPSQEEGI
jgi:hypothetical protein